MSGTPCEVRAAAPTLGQHTDEVLTTMLGYSRSEVDAMRAKGALD
jgi:crotonobetainyl-CoA:carnitine CoA-transferase CaiB-like acyl-CoA transferase